MRPKVLPWVGAALPWALAALALIVADAVWVAPHAPTQTQPLALSKVDDGMTTGANETRLVVFVNNAGTTMASLKDDGTVDIDPRFTDDEVAVAFWEAMARESPFCSCNAECVKP